MSSWRGRSTAKGGRQDGNSARCWDCRWWRLALPGRFGSSWLSRQRTVPLVPELRAILHDWILKGTHLKPRSFVIAPRGTAGRTSASRWSAARSDGRGGWRRRLQPASLPAYVRNRAARAWGGHSGDSGHSWPWPPGHHGGVYARDRRVGHARCSAPLRPNDI